MVDILVIESVFQLLIDPPNNFHVSYKNTVLTL